MADYKTPGVYIEEISTLPASVAPVATAVPAFIGYTEKAIVDNVAIDPATTRTPVRITSMLEFIAHFGGPFQEYYSASITDPPSGETEVGLSVSSIGANESPYVLYYQVRMFYANGGGNCYVVSVGTYTQIDESDPTTMPTEIDAIAIDDAALLAGLNVCEEIDEITLLTIPEAMALSDTDRKPLFDTMLVQCNKLQDRFAILDVEADVSSTVFNDGNNFRNDNVGPDYLKYAAAYYPSLHTLIEFSFDEDKVQIVDTTTAPNAALWNGKMLSNINSGLESDGTTAISKAASATITVLDNTSIDGDVFTVDGTDFTEGTEFTKGGDASATAGLLAAQIDTLPNVSAINNGAVVVIQATASGAAGNGIAINYTDSGTGIAASISGPELEGGVDQYLDTNLYNRIKKELQKHKVTLYPCGAIAGIYAAVDRDRGVWKAPANVSVNLVKEPTIQVTAAEQGDLNVDATTGKSINAIRFFNGKGNIVWGARTLAGNDNEWRYVPVRRFYNFMEESIKKATEFVIFEPNSKPTWVKTKAMIENFLTQLWRDGALAGAKPEHAFFVKIGLGETMTAVDILEGRMNIEIGVAAVRPAEFIILKFSHKLQES
ncbi:phage tail sheath family protein [Arenibacter lacus]|uniref:phage tail sheath family protein n=1 Tax=Arenibacter lacus TaxID=2608629 RepID=UPI00123DDE9B|nr:phage tail sheath C-terminal domain-containing protein [Arenibacter lacus]